MPKASFTSDFVILDVKRGRKALAARLAAGEKVRVFIAVDLDCQHSRDDGTSVEFSGAVVRLEETEAA